jgi:alpha-tubulin suppressor-like RCC1 family protein
MFLDDTGRIWVCGANYGQLGIPSPDRENIRIPTLVPGFENVVSVQAYKYGFFIQDESGEIYQFGLFNYVRRPKLYC